MPPKRVRASKAKEAITTATTTGLAAEAPAKEEFIGPEIIAHLPVRSSMLAEAIATQQYDLVPGVGAAAPIMIVPRVVSRIAAKTKSQEEIAAAEAAGLEDTRIQKEMEDALTELSELHNASAGVTVDSTPADPAFHRPDIEAQLMEYSEAGGVRSAFPRRTENPCYWDGHTFGGTPCAIPLRLIAGTHHAPITVEVDHRIFCSPECAAAQIFADQRDSSEQHERFSLLNMIYKDFYPLGHVIIPAPPKDLLRVFGGTLTIAGFRALLAEHRLRVEVVLHPMIATMPTLNIRRLENPDDAFTRGNLKLKRSEHRPSLDPFAQFKIPRAKIETPTPPTAVLT